MARTSLAVGMDSLLAAALRGELTEAQARELARREPGLVILALARRITATSSYHA